MIKVFKLRKDTPEHKRGTVFAYCPKDDLYKTEESEHFNYSLLPKTVESQPDWFEDVTPTKWSKELRQVQLNKAYRAGQLGMITTEHNIKLSKAFSATVELSRESAGRHAATPEDAISAAAFNVLSFFLKEANGDWKPDWTSSEPKFFVEPYIHKGEVLFEAKGTHHVCYNPLMFKDREAAQHSIEYHRLYWIKYYKLEHLVCKN